LYPVMPRHLLADQSAAASDGRPGGVGGLGSSVVDALSGGQFGDHRGGRPGCRPSMPCLCGVGAGARCSVASSVSRCTSGAEARRAVAGGGHRDADGDGPGHPWVWQWRAGGSRPRWGGRRSSPLSARG